VSELGGFTASGGPYNKQELIVPLSSAQLIALGAKGSGNDITLLPAPGAKQMYVPDRIIMIARNGVAYTAGELDVSLNTAGLPAAATWAARSYFGFLDQATDQIVGYFDANLYGGAPNPLSRFENLSLKLSNESGSAFATGTGTAEIHIVYRVMTLP
jgi:hypothetical protein